MGVAANMIGNSESVTSHVLVGLGSYLDRYGYWAVFVGVLLEDFGIPMPGETILIAAATIAGATGKMSIALLLLTAWVALLIGDNLAYAVGRFAGRRLVLRYGPLVLITPQRLARAESFYRHYGPLVVLISGSSS